MTISPGENVGPYRIVEQLGSGGMATVYKGYQPSLDRYVAIKVMHPMFKGNPQFFERFKREARIVAKLEHPNIIPIHDFNEHKGEPYLVMRYVEGDTLKPRLEGQPMPPNDVLRIIRPVCSALNYAHNQGVLHRDIKPSNIMVTTDGTIFVTDFGLARMVEAGESTLSQDMMVGTPQYISPEQAQGVKELDGRTDIYSLGVVLYEMLTGRVPFSADTPFATVHDHIYTPLPPPSSVNPNINPAVERMLLKALAKDPQDRYATAKDLLEAVEVSLEAQTAQSPTVAQTPAPVAVSTPAPEEKTTLSSRKSSATPWWVWAGGAGLAILIIAVLLVGLLILRRSRQAPLPLPNQPAPAQVNDGNQPAPLPNEQSQPDQPAPPLAEGQPGDMPPPPGIDLDSPEGRQAFDLIKTGQDHLLNENPEAALEAFSEAAALVPEAPMPYAGQALALMMMDQDPPAREAIDRALALDPRNAEARLANAIFLFRHDDRIEARRQLQELAQDQQVPPFVRERANQMLERLGK